MSMDPDPIKTRPWWHACRWTLLFTALITAANAELLLGAGSAFAGLIKWLQFDRHAILAGQFWRLVTGNLVHWSVAHFLLDIGAFLLVGLMIEGHLRRHYASILVASAAAVGCGVLAFAPEATVYRGLSGVDSGQFAAVLCVESAAALRDRRRWTWVAPALSIFVLKIAYECASGQMFFGTESLGNIGIPTPVAHAAGAAAAVAFVGGTMLVQSPRLRNLLSGMTLSRRDDKAIFGHGQNMW